MVRVGDVSGKERLIGDDVDQPGIAAAEPVDPVDRLRIEPDLLAGGRPLPRALPAGDRDPRLDVSRHLFPLQRLDFIDQRDPLLELPELFHRQLLLQLGLADQKDLDQLLLIGRQVREEADLLQALDAEELRLVDDQEGVPPLSEEIEKKVVQLVEQDLLRLTLPFQSEVLIDALQELDGGELRVEEERRPDRRIDLAQKEPAEGGLAGPDLADDDDEPFPLLQAVEDVGEGLVMPLAEEKKPGIGGEFEGGLFKTEKFKIHRISPGIQRMGR